MRYPDSAGCTKPEEEPLIWKKTLPVAFNVEVDSSAIISNTDSILLVYSTEHMLVKVYTTSSSNSTSDKAGLQQASDQGERWSPILYKEAYPSEAALLESNGPVPD